MTLALVLGAALALGVVLFVARPFLREPSPASDRARRAERARAPAARARRGARPRARGAEGARVRPSHGEGHRRGLPAASSGRCAAARQRRYVLSSRGQRRDMSASQVAADTCPNCGAGLPATARFCPACGVQVDAGSTVQEQIPPNETGPVPVSLQRSEPHWFGVAPPQLLLSVAVVAFVFAIVLFATGHWPFGLILLGAAALLLAAFLEAARRRPRSGADPQRPSMRASAHARRGRRCARARPPRPRRAGSQTALLLLDSPTGGAALHELGAAAYVGRRGGRGDRARAPHGARRARERRSAPSSPRPWARRTSGSARLACRSGDPARASAE